MKPTRNQFDAARDILESARKKTRPRKHDLYDVFCAGLSRIESGTGWRHLPAGSPPWRTVHEYFTQWTAPRDGGTLLELALAAMGMPPVETKQQ